MFKCSHIFSGQQHMTSLSSTNYFLFSKTMSHKNVQCNRPNESPGAGWCCHLTLSVARRTPQAFYSAIKMTNPDHLSKHFKKWGALLLIFVRGTHSCAWDIFAFSSLHFNCMLLVCCLTKYCSFLPPLSSAKCD